MAYYNRHAPIVLTSTGKFDRTEDFLKKILKLDIKEILNRYGEKGVEALKLATPKDSGLTSESWYYTVDTYRGGSSISWWNSNVNDGVPIAIIIQYGHGTGFGGYVAPVDYVNPALQPIFDEIADTVWEVVENA